jgi:hypothetical protein
MTINLEETSDVLPFEPKLQDALLGYILMDRPFFLSVKDRLKASWFVDGWSGKVYGYYTKFYDTYQHEPKSDDEFFSFEDIFISTPAEKNKVKATILRARNETKNFSLDVLKTGLTGWLQSRIYHQYVTQSASLYNNRKFGAAKDVLATAVKELQDVTFEGKPPLDFDPTRLVNQIQTVASDALTFGHPLIDKILNPDCKSGSCLPGDSTVLLAPTNIGKTTCKITIALANVMQGKSVLFVAHEGRALDIQEKIWQAVLKVTKAQFRALATSDDPIIRNKLLAVAKILADRLVFIDDQRPGNTVEDVISKVRQQQIRRKGILGSGFDMLVDDYPAILGAGGLSNLKMQRREKDAYVYRYFVDYVGEQGMHGLFSVQTNREGSKKNRKVGGFEDSKALVTLEDIQESYEVTNSATNLITLNRSPDDQVLNLMTFLLCKSRSSEVNVAVTCRSSFETARTHDANLPAVAYHGTSALDGLNTLLMEYNNQVVPFNYKELRNATVKS